MKRFARVLAVMFGLAVIGAFVSLVPQKSATAVGGAPVTIMSPVPLPVTGNVAATVSGTVGAQQSGAWNVGLASGATVGINNQGSAPVPTEATDDPGKHPVTQSCIFVVTLGSFPGSEQARCQMPGVPEGVELVVDSASARFQTTDPNAQPTDIQLTSTVGGNPYTVDIPYPPSVFPGAGAFPFGQVVRTFVDPTTEVTCTINVVGATLVSQSGGTCSIAGHLVAKQ